MLHEFYDECAAAVWERDGIVNKFIGDAVLAIFNFPIMREDHVRQAVLTAIELQRKWSEKKKLTVINADGRRSVGVGVGIPLALLLLERLAPRTRFHDHRPDSESGLSVQGTAKSGRSSCGRSV
jgi:class 3 adenylate cyclase